jgi:hypothetical protein
MAYAEGDKQAQAWMAAFRDGLEKLGWMENGNVRIDYRWATAEVAQIQQQALVANHQSGEHQGGMKRRVAAFIQPSAFSHLMPAKGMSERLKVRVTIKDRAQ